MKANEMPEKIYIFDYNDAMVTPLEGDTVYVRKDAFIEKACKYLEPDVMIMLAGDKIDTDKFIEDFRKYMKGE